MIREELLHPAISHFPIALLVLVLFTKLTQIMLPKKFEQLEGNLNIISKFLLIVGASMLLPSLFLGDIAFDIVKENICHLTVAYKHEEMAHNTLIVFIISIALETSLSVKGALEKFHPPLKALLIFSLFLGNYFLLKTAHLGGELVYEEGAGVTRALTPCQ